MADFLDVQADFRGAFQQADRISAGILRVHRKSVQNALQRVRKALQEEAPRSVFRPDGHETQDSEPYWQGIRTRTRLTGAGSVAGEVYQANPDKVRLTPLLVRGYQGSYDIRRGRRIVPRVPLRFWWYSAEQGPHMARRAWTNRKAARANPFIQRAWSRVGQATFQAVRAEARNFQANVSNL
jgi:hypothetical protein